MVRPPSTTIVCPVTEDAPGDLVGTAEPAQRHGPRQLASAFDAHPLVEPRGAHVTRRDGVDADAETPPTRR
jgi:hypothetical protein